MLGAAATVGGATLSLGWLNSLSLARELEESAQSHARSTSKSLANLLEAKIERDLSAVASLAERIAYELPVLEAELINPIIDPWQKQFPETGLVTVAAANADGLAWSGMSPAEARKQNVNYGFREYYTGLIEFQTALVSTVEVGRVSKKPNIHFVAPIGRPMRGFVTTSLDLIALKRTTQRALSDMTGTRAVVWDWNGHVVFDTGAPDAVDVRRLTGALYAPVRGTAQWRTGMDEEGRAVMGAVAQAQVGPRAWNVFVSRSAQMVYARVDTAQRNVVWTALIVLMVAWALSLFLSRLIARPISALSSAAEAVEGGDLKAMSALPGGMRVREARDLETALRKMVDQLGRNQEVLDAKVAERTRELAEARDAALEASRAKTAFIASMSHELRTPLNGVVGSLQVLADSVEGSDRDLAEDAQRSTRALHALLEDIIDYSTMEAGQLALSAHEVDVRAIFERVVADYRGVVKGSSVDLRMSLDLGPVMAIGDPDRLAQIWKNLIDNAVKFTSEGEVRCTLRTERVFGAAVRVISTIEDTGPGIAPERLTHIFEDFAQADGSMSRRHGGTGLGLAITRHLTRLMSGDIEVQSEVGCGSCFTVTLLLLAPAELQTPKAKPSRIVVAAPPSPDRELLLAHAALANLDVQLVAPGTPIVTTPAVVADDWPDPIPADAIKWGPSGQGIPCLHTLEELLDALKAKNDRIVPKDVRVLAVDDNLVNLKVVSRMLERMGLDVDVASGGREALEQLQANTYHLVFMDCQMPEMDGLEATRRIRAQGWSSTDLPVVALTANTSADDRMACFEAGMNDHVGKPIRKDILHTVLTKWLSR